MKQNKAKYVISFDWKSNIVIVCMTLLFGGVAYALYYKHSQAFVPVAVLAGICCVVMIISIHRTMFNKIIIYDDSFTHIKSIFKTEYLMDYEIKDAWISGSPILKNSRAVYFNYEAKDFKKGKIMIPPAQEDYADYLVERLKGNDVTEYEEYIENQELTGKIKAPKSASLFEKMFVYSNKGVYITLAIGLALFAVIFGTMFVNSGEKTVYTAQQFQEAMQKYDYDVADTTEEKKSENSSIVGAVTVKDDPQTFEFIFIELNLTDSARALYTSLYNQLWDIHDPHKIDGESYYNNYSSHYFYDKNGNYYTIVRVSNTVVFASAKDESRNIVYELLTEIDYDDKTDKQQDKG